MSARTRIADPAWDGWVLTAWKGYGAPAHDYDWGSGGNWIVDPPPAKRGGYTVYAGKKGLLTFQRFRSHNHLFSLNAADIERVTKKGDGRAKALAEAMRLAAIGQAEWASKHPNEVSA